ncbi:DUF4230 domain-containing protein [Pleurocapsales cyanobacterium LEGE 06147]|nr:DUF4230 domain-containing protein [Pleurocapsales cyanobacterium LEGE 06147]
MKSSKQSFSFLKHLLLVSTGGISLVVLLSIVGMRQIGERFAPFARDRVLTLFEGILQPAPLTAQIEISTLILQKMQEANELTTAVYNMETVVPASADRQIGQFVLATTNLIYIGQGEVRAGVDLSQLNETNIKVTPNKIHIDLPPPQILDGKIDVHRSRVYDYNRGFLNLGPDVAPQLQTLAQQKTLEQIVNAACSEGLLEKANERAREAIAQILATTGERQVEIKTTPPLPNHCSVNYPR